MSEVVKEIKRVVRESSDTIPEGVARYFKTGKGEYAEHDKFVGISVPLVRKIAKKYEGVSLDEITELLDSKYNEERLLALIILAEKYKKSEEAERERIYHFYLENLARVNNWNLVDSSAHLIVGAYLTDKDRSILLKLAKSEDLWERRVAIIATLYFIREKDLDWTYKIALILLKDPHDLIHKAVGWMLREAGKQDEASLRRFLKEHKNNMPKTMLRSASERL